jgi:hypothetical protein
MQPPIAEPRIACPQQAMRRLVGDTLRQVAALDVTSRADIERTLNLVERLLVVIGQPSPAARRTMQAMLHGGASERAGLVARLYRDLMALPDARHGTCA